MSALQKQLQARRAKAPNRVGHKQKKFLAMMEQETVIDDPSVKAARLLSYKKIEVCKTTVEPPITDPLRCTNWASQSKLT